MSEDLTFEKFPKMARLKRQCVITEKIDGTNAQILFNSEGDMLVGSRNRVIVPGDDNYGFARWAYDNQLRLMDVLGKGRHYGEWWGHGIQRGYGMPQGLRKFSLFNVARWLQDDTEKLKAVDGLGVVPILYYGIFSDESSDDAMNTLKMGGSYANLGFIKPEGICIWHSATRAYYKRTFEHDETGKPE